MDHISLRHASSDPENRRIQQAADYAKAWADTDDMYIKSQENQGDGFLLAQSLEPAPATTGDVVLQREGQSKLLGVTRTVL